MKEIVLLAGILVILMYALALTQERDSVDGYEIISCRIIERNGDTLRVENIMVKTD